MKYPAVIICSTVLAACGGGGDGTVTVPPQPAPAPVSVSATLTSANQDVVAQETSSTVTFPISNTGLLIGAEVADQRLLFTFANDQIAKLPDYIASLKAGSTLVGAIESQTVPCANSGSLNITGTDADNNGVLSSGDRLTITSNACNENGSLISGSLDFNVGNVSGTFGSTNYSAALTLAFVNFSVASAQYSVTANGTLSLSTTASGVNSLDQTLSTPSLAMSATFAGVPQTISLSSYSATVRRRPDPTYTFTTSYSLSGSLTSSSLSSQTVAFSTPSPIISRYFDLYPSTGVLLITGANSSKLRLTALSNTQVSQELDSNGDGTYESIKTVNWNTLL